MTKLNEDKIIRIFQTQLGNKKFTPEDVEVFKIGKRVCVIKTDTLVESTDVPPQMKLTEAARKSLVAPVSDFAAKGVKPLYGVISLTIPRRFSTSKIRNIAIGLGKAAKEFDIKILGGDTNEGQELVIQVTLFGTTKKIVTRKGSKINDIIIATGPFGYSSAGLKILLNQKKALKKFASKARKSVLRPIPRLEFGIKNQGNLSASMDSSDGLSTTLNELAKQSKKKFVITNIPAKQDLIEFAKRNSLNAMDLIFNGGEEYEIIATVRPSNLAKIKKSAKNMKIPLYQIGYVTKGNGVILQNGTKKIPIKDRGWKHFD